MRHPRTGFTLIELLVVVAIIVALIAILLPSLGRAVEVTHRAVCGSNVHQIYLGALNYAADHRRQFPHTSSTPSNATWDQLSWIAPRAYLELADGLTWDDLGTSAAIETVQRQGEMHLHCPNRIDGWYRQSRDGAGIRIGYFTHFGRVDTPVWDGSGYGIATETWRSPLTVSDASGSTVMLADIIEENTLVPAVDTGSHSGGGFVSVPYDGGLDNNAPVVMGIEGSNVGFGDGSVRWRSVSDLLPYPSTKPYSERRRGWW